MFSMNTIYQGILIDGKDKVRTTKLHKVQTIRFITEVKEKIVLVYERRIFILSKFKILFLPVVNNYFLCKFIINSIFFLFLDKIHLCFVKRLY